MSRGRDRPLRLRFEHELSDRAIGRSCSVSHRTVADYVHRFYLSGLSWPLPGDLDDKSLEEKLFPEKTSPSRPPAAKKMPDLKYLHRELKRPGVTLHLLWEEYHEQVPDGYGRTQFYDHYRRWAKRLHPTLRQDHKAGEKVFVDWAGKKPEIVDPLTGEVRPVELFVACLGASSYTYAEADAHAAASGLDRGAHTHARVLRRRAGHRGPGQHPHRRNACLPVRTGPEPHVPGLRRSLRAGHCAGTSR